MSSKTTLTQSQKDNIKSFINDSTSEFRNFIEDQINEHIQTIVDNAVEEFRQTADDAITEKVSDCIDRFDGKFAIDFEDELFDTKCDDFIAYLSKICPDIVNSSGNNNLIKQLRDQLIRNGNQKYFVMHSGDEYHRVQRFYFKHMYVDLEWHRPASYYSRLQIKNHLLSSDGLFAIKYYGFNFPNPSSINPPKRLYFVQQLGPYYKELEHEKNEIEKDKQLLLEQKKALYEVKQKLAKLEDNLEKEREEFLKEKAKLRTIDIDSFFAELK